METINPPDQRARWLSDYMDALEQSALSPYTRHILAVLARMADPDTGRVPDAEHMSIDGLARRTGMSIRALTNNLSRAEAAGWLVRTHPENHGIWLHTEYRVTMPVPGGAA